MKKTIRSWLCNPTHARRVLAAYWLLLAVGSHLPHLSVGKDANQIGVFQIDKTLHVIAFAGLTWLLYLARPGGARVSGFGHALIAACVAGGYALVDEYTQRWTGRDISLSDVVAGYVGILGVFLILTAPPPEQNASRFTQSARIVTAVVLLGMFVISVAPDGNRWVNGLASPFFQPWPQIDKTGHFYVAAALTLLVGLSRPAGVHRPRHGVLLTILVVGLSGPIIETVQSYTGRSVEMADLYAHQLGLLAALAGWSAMTVLRVLRRRSTG